MNLSNEESNLQLFKYIPEVTSQLLIQSSESQELVQVPNICDDLMLTGLEEGNAAWTLGLPVLLNTPLMTTDQQPFLINQLSAPEDDPNNELESQNVELNNLQMHDNGIHSSGCQQNEDDFDENEMLLKVSPARRFISEDGLFISRDELDEPPTFEDNSNSEFSSVTEDSEIIVPETEIQSSDISSQEAFIDINGVIIPKSSILHLNGDEMFFDVQNSQTDEVFNKCSKKKRVKRRTVHSNLQKFENKKDINIQNNLYIENHNVEFENNEEYLLHQKPAHRLIEVVHFDGTTTLLNVDGTMLDNHLLLKHDSDIVSNNNLTDEEVQIVDEEPDSTVANDYDPLNIDDLATVITAYQCKKCPFSCNDQEIFLDHFREVHTQQIVEGSFIDDKSMIEKIEHDMIIDENEMIEQDMNDEQNNMLELDTNTEDNDLNQDINVEHMNMQTMHIFYEPTDEYSELCLTAEDDIQKKIMRVKRKPKKLKHRRIVPTPQFQLIFPFSNDVEEQNEDNNVIISEHSPLIEEDITSPIISENITNVEIPNEKLIYLCSQCAEQFDTIVDCRNHMINIHKLQSLDDKDEENKEMIPVNNDPLLMNIDDLQKKNKTTIEKFLTADILKTRKNKCTVRGCQYRFAKPELLKRHESCHVEGLRNQFQCPECEEKYLSWRLCSVHLWRCHQMDIDLYACPLCNYRGSTPIKLRNHLKIHSEDREFVCPDCGRGFKQASQLRNHRVIHLDKELHEVPKWYTQKHCDKCGKDFADSKCLKKHIQAVHSKLKPFICNVCGHSCARKAMLQMHLRQHTGEKPYACKICYYKTGDHNSLRRHIMRHSGVRPYKCPHCDYTAIQSNSYKNHLANKHPGMGGSYSCTECNFKSVNEEAFAGHINDHRNGLITPSDIQKGRSLSQNSISIIANSTNILYEYTDSNSGPEINENVSENFQTANQGQHGKGADTEDDETQHCFLSLNDLNDEQTVDTGGITIPADPIDM